MSGGAVAFVNYTDEFKPHSGERQADHLHLEVLSGDALRRVSSLGPQPVRAGCCVRPGAFD